MTGCLHIPIKFNDKVAETSPKIFCDTGYSRGLSKISPTSDSGVTKTVILRGNGVDLRLEKVSKMSILKPFLGIIPENSTSLSIKTVKKVFSAFLSDIFHGGITNSCNSTPDGIIPFLNVDTQGE